MSAIALSWIATIKVGNQTAKQLLQFYASHNFNKPGFEFKNDTLAEQLEVKVRAIQNAHKLLIKKGFLNKEERFGSDGSQLTSIYYLNIPNEFVDNFFKRGGEGVFKTSPPCLKDTPRGVLKTPLNNNINNKENKREVARKKREALPENFKPDQEREARARAVCQRCNINYDDLLNKFKTIYKGKYNKCDTWQDDFDLFLTREKPSTLKPNKESKLNQEVKCTVPDYVRDIPIKTASISVVNENMSKIKQLLSGKMINGKSRRESDISKGA